MSADIDFDALDRQSGAGSRDETDDWMDQHSRVHPNDWSTSRTTFYVSDAPAEKRRKYEDLKSANDGFGEKDRRGTIRDAKVLKDTYSFCVMCDLNDDLRNRVVEIVTSSDISSRSYGGKQYEKIVLSVMSLVVDESIDTEDGFDRRLIFDDTFIDLMDSIGMDRSELRTVRQMVRDRMSEF